MATIIDRMGFFLAGHPAYSGIYLDGAAPNGDVTGTLSDAAGVEAAVIHGSFDSASNAISFNNADFPGEILFTCFFTGQVFTSPDGTSAVGMAGEWHEQSFKVTQVGGKPKVTGFTNRSGMWLAYNPARNPN